MGVKNLLNLIALQCAIVANCHLSRKLKCLRTKSGTFSSECGSLAVTPLPLSAIAEGQEKLPGGYRWALWRVYVHIRRSISIYSLDAINLAKPSSGLMKTNTAVSNLYS